mmetsp:Transcript_11828/g.32309  ORF Transcript_11828/g.32309 Transcript_11828/m.32309 type:complete len:280 (+) Transcript_11828:234-1073(+)
MSKTLRASQLRQQEVSSSTALCMTAERAGHQLTTRAGGKVLLGVSLLGPCCCCCSCSSSLAAWAMELMLLMTKLEIRPSSTKLHHSAMVSGTACCNHAIRASRSFSISRPLCQNHLVSAWCAAEWAVTLAWNLAMDLFTRTCSSWASGNSRDRPGMCVGNTLSNQPMIASRVPWRKRATKKSVCKLTLTKALPSSVAPKKCQKGILKAPQQSPHKSKAALGQEASKKMPRNPWFWMKPIIQRSMRDTKRFIGPPSWAVPSSFCSISSSASAFLPATAAL